MNKHKFFYFLFVFTFALSSQIKAQYEINVHIKNLKDSSIYLGYYFGDKQYAKDTAQLNSKGNATFKGNDTLPGGLYFVLLPGSTMFEIIIDKEQKFSVATKYTGDPIDLTKNLTANGSKDLEVYIEYQKFMTFQGEKAMKLRKSLQKEENANIKAAISDSLKILNKEVKGKWDDIENNHSESLLASILQCLKEIEIPEPPKDENGVITDSMFQYRYYKKHYFDHINFNDARLLRTQFFHSKIDRYFEKMILPAPDTIIKESKMVLDLAMVNNEVFQYTLQTLFNKYNNSNIMGMDKAFVFFAENYYLNGKAEWADEEWIEKVKERVLEIKPNLVGNKAPELKLIGIDTSLITLSSIPADYTILFFYEPGCGHCKKAAIKLSEMSNFLAECGAEVIAIYTQFEQKEWIKFVKDKKLEHWINAWDPYNQSGFRTNYDVKTTPTVYLLDKNKNIIGKRIDVETVEKILKDLTQK